MNEKIKKLDNTVKLNGILAELGDLYEGVTKTGNIPYLSFKGKIQCGTDPALTVPFKTFIKSRKSDGSISTNFKAVKQWYMNAVPLTKDPDHPTMCSLFGSVVDNPWVNSDGKMVPSVEYNIVSFKDFNMKDGYMAQVDLEGYIQSITEEIKGVGDDQEATGRYKMSFVSQDMFHNVLHLQDIIINPDKYLSFTRAGYEEGITTTVRINLEATETEARQVSGAWGDFKTTGGKAKIEKTLVGAGGFASEETALTPAVVKTMLNERAAALDTKLKAELDRRAASGSTTGFVDLKVASAKTPADIDEDIPF